MISLIQNENMKVYKRTRTWVMIGIAIVYIILQVFNIKTAVEDTTRVNWQLQLEQENRQLSKVAKQSDVLPIEIKQSKRQILLNQYHLDHNIPPSTNGWKFTIDQLRNIVFAATLLSIIIAGEIMAGEYASGTIKLLLTRSASRTQIYIAKYVASLLFALLLATVCVGGAMIFTLPLCSGSDGHGNPRTTGIMVGLCSTDTVLARCYNACLYDFYCFSEHDVLNRHFDVSRSCGVCYLDCDGWLGVDTVFYFFTNGFDSVCLWKSVS